MIWSMRFCLKFAGFFQNCICVSVPRFVSFFVAVLEHCILHNHVSHVIIPFRVAASSALAESATASHVSHSHAQQLASAGAVR